MADQTEKSIDETPISPIQRRDSLEKHLQTRPEAKDLKDRHILLDTNAAPYVMLVPTPPLTELTFSKITSVQAAGAGTPACHG